MDKLLTIPQYDVNGEPNTRLLPSMHPAIFEKTAGVLPAEVQEYLANFKPNPDFLHLLIVALGASDYWGSNVNGDAFFEDDLLGMQSEFEAAKNPAPYTNKRMQRYKTFCFAKIRKHHQNKDHHPAYGHVELPVYDNKMKRVLLIVAVDRKRAPDIVAESEAGRPIVWSMGCKVAKDICSSCGNGAKRVSDYCDHLKYQMNQILPSGDKVYAINRTPRFFDISKVVIPADKTAFTLMKLAGDISSKTLDTPNYYDNLSFDGDMSKVASAMIVPSAFAAEHMKVAEKLSAEKSGEITKRIPAETADSDLSDNAVIEKALRSANAISKSEKNIPDDVLAKLKGVPLHEVLSSMAGLGMVAKPCEFKKLSSDGLEDLPITSAASINSDAVKALVPFMDERSAFSPWIEKRSSIGSEEVDVSVDNVISDEYMEYRSRLMGWDCHDTQRTIEKYASLISFPVGAEEDMFNLMTGMTKTSGLGSASATAGLAASTLFAPYVASAHLRLKGAHEGRRLDGVEKVIADNPGKLGVTASLGSTFALAKLLGKI